MTALLWFRRDLRVNDHPALHAALAAHESVVPVFCLDDRLLHGRHASAPRTRFLLESLHDLRQRLEALGSGLVVRRGSPAQVLPDLARRTGATEIHYTRDVTPYARTRGNAVRAALDAAGVTQIPHPGLCVIDDVGAPRTQAGTPYAVFSPFFRVWDATPRRAVLPDPERLPPLPLADLDNDPNHEPLPSLAALGFTDEKQEYALPGGESAAMSRLAWFLSGPVHDYARDRDRLDIDGTSKLSPYLHFGCISPRAVEAALCDSLGSREFPRSEGADAVRRQLCWRDFYHHVMQHHPDNAQREHQQRYRGTLRWVDDKARFTAWTEGRTGFPLVDAAMRQLLAEGWMHNRARLVAGSFLTKHLGIDWRHGESWFMRLLLDGDQANNNGNWQWIASVGVDPQPVYRRLYSPTLHEQRYDPSGVYVRRYVPELRRVPQEYLAEPWTMPASVQKGANCILGVDYPRPIIDLRAAREDALQRYSAAAADTRALASRPAKR